MSSVNYSSKVITAPAVIHGNEYPYEPRRGFFYIKNVDLVNQLLIIIGTSESPLTQLFILNTGDIWNPIEAPAGPVYISGYGGTANYFIITDVQDYVPF